MDHVYFILYHRYVHTIIFYFLFYFIFPRHLVFFFFFCRKLIVHQITIDCSYHGPINQSFNQPINLSSVNPHNPQKNLHQCIFFSYFDCEVDKKKRKRNNSENFLINRSPLFIRIFCFFFWCNNFQFMQVVKFYTHTVDRFIRHKFKFKEKS